MINSHGGIKSYFGKLIKAPTGRNVIAQGAALGLEIDKKDEKPCKGGINMSPLLRPFRA
jgi:hypothetical protein